MATIQLPAPSAASTIASRQQVSVKVRQKWSDDWQTIKYLEALQCTASAAPSVPTAQLRWRSGLIKWEDRRSFATFQPREYRGWYVRIELLSRSASPMALFTGRICDDDEINLGPSQSITRDQELTAFGLAQDLDREHIYGSWITNDGEAAQQIGISLSFNERFIRGLRETGNRSVQRVTGTIDGVEKKAVAFSDARDSGFAAYPWTVQNIVEYLLTWYAPAGQTWVMAGQLDALANLEPPRFNPHGMTVWQALNEVIDRRRGIGFTVDCPGDTPTIRIFTTIGQAVKFDQASLPANNRQADFNLGASHMIDSPSVRVDACASYDWIHIVGEPVLACFTVCHEDGTLAKGWTAAKETAYKTAVGPGDTRKNDAERATDKFEHVFTKFIIPSNWGWQAGDGQGGAKQLVHRLPAEDGKLLAGSLVTGAYRKWGHTLEGKLPLLKDQRDTPGNRDVQPEYREPFVLLYDEVLKIYRYADNPAVPEDIPGQVRMLDNEFGISCTLSKNHLLALEQWGGANPSETQPKYNWQKMIATVAARQDCTLSVIVKVRRPGDNGSGRRVLVINVPDAELWHIAAGTVIEVEKGALKRQTAAEVLRDDSARLRQVAAVALAWYGDDHAVLNVTSKRFAPYAIGTFIRKAIDPRGDRQINSVVSSLSFDLVNQTTQLQTNYGEMDFAAAGAGPRGYHSIK